MPLSTPDFPLLAGKRAVIVEDEGMTVLQLTGILKRVGVEVDEETGLEDVKFLDLGVQLALLMSISGVSPSLEVDSFPLSGDAAAFSRSLSDRLISLLLSLLLVLLLKFEVFSRSLVEEDLTGERQEDEVDEEEGLEQQEDAAVANVTAAGDEKKRDGQDGGFVKIERENERQETPGGDWIPGDGVGQRQAAREHAGGAEQVKWVVLCDQTHEQGGRLENANHGRRKLRSGFGGFIEVVHRRVPSYAGARQNRAPQWFVLLRKHDTTEGSVEWRPSFLRARQPPEAGMER